MKQKREGQRKWKRGGTKEEKKSRKGQTKKRNGNGWMRRYKAFVIMLLKYLLTYLLTYEEVT